MMNADIEQDLHELSPLQRFWVAIYHNCGTISTCPQLWAKTRLDAKRALQPLRITGGHAWIKYSE